MPKCRNADAAKCRTTKMPNDKNAEMSKCRRDKMPNDKNAEHSKCRTKKMPKSRNGDQKQLFTKFHNVCLARGQQRRFHILCNLEYFNIISVIAVIAQYSPRVRLYSLVML